MSFLKLVFMGALICFIVTEPVVLGCEESCSVGADCPDPLCKGCVDDGFESLCNDCCPESNQVECGKMGCHWEWSGIEGKNQCRNESGVDCTGISEVPAKNKSWLIVGFAFVGLVLAGALRFKKRKAL